MSEDAGIPTPAWIPTPHIEPYAIGWSADGSRLVATVGKSESVQSDIVILGPMDAESRYPWCTRPIPKMNGLPVWSRSRWARTRSLVRGFGRRARALQGVRAMDWLGSDGRQLVTARGKNCP
jgi:hypothetical protein